MFETILYLIGLLQGWVLAYILFAPKTEFKKSFLSGIALEFIWKRFVK
jgi:hypothetical protein